MARTKQPSEKHELPSMPTLPRENVNAMTKDELTEAYIALRLFCGQLFMWAKDFVNGAALEEALTHRLTTVETQADLALTRINIDREKALQLASIVETLKASVSESRFIAINSRLEALEAKMKESDNG